MNELKDRLTIMAQNFCKGRLTEIAALYEFPAAVYTKNGTLVLQDEDQFLEKLTAYRDVLVEHGFSAIHSRPMRTREGGGGATVVTVQNTYFNTAKAEFARAVIRYFVESPFGSAKIRLVEYEEVPLEDEVLSTPELAALGAPRVAMH